MSVQFTDLAVKPKGNLAASVSYGSGAGYFTAYRAGTLMIECWGKGGMGADSWVLSGPFALPVGGAGGGSGGYCTKNVSTTAGMTFKWSISASGDSTAWHKPTASMTATHGGNAVQGTGGAGGTASGGGRNFAGQSGTSVSTGTSGGKGGNATSGGAGGNGGVANQNGYPGAAPGGGGGGGGATAGLGAAGGDPQVRFTWL